MSTLIDIGVERHRAHPLFAGTGVVEGTLGATLMVMLA